MKNSGKATKSNGNGNGNGNGKAEQDVRKDRRSATGMKGSPKKGGHGGKFTWSGNGYSQAELGMFHNEAAAVDPNDPNYEADD